MKLFVIVFAALWPVLLNTTSGVRSLHPTLLEATRSLQLGAIARVTKIFLPALLPSILTGVRVAAPLAVIVSLLAVTGTTCTVGTKSRRCSTTATASPRWV